jgi:hypothetical protein
MKMLDSIGYDLRGKHAVVIGRSNIVGKPMALMLLQKNATVTICHSRTKDLAAVCRSADILCAAIGKPEMVQGDWIKEGAILPGIKPAVASTTPAAPKKSLPPIMSWTNLEGKTIRAGFVRLDGANVVLRMPANGQEVPYPIAKLDAESQKQAQEAGAP